MDEVNGRPGLTPEQRVKISRQLGDYVRQLSAIRFPQIGSLFVDEKGSRNYQGKAAYTIGPCLAPALTWLQRDELDNLDRGPFSSDKDYFNALTVGLSRHCQELSMSSHALTVPMCRQSDFATYEELKRAHSWRISFLALADKLEQHRNRFEFCLAAEMLRERVVPQLCASQREHEGFPLMHNDLSSGNIFVDDDRNITCVIDWSSATTVPDVELFATPLWSVWQRGAGPELVHAFRQTAAPIQGWLNDADFWAKTDKVGPWQRLMRFTSYHDLDDLTALMGRDVDGIVDLFQEHTKREHNQALLAALKEDEFTPEELAAEEKCRFSEDSWRARNNVLAVTRKLSIAWELNPRFVADKRLWKWLFKVLDEDQEALDKEIAPVEVVLETKVEKGCPQDEKQTAHKTDLGDPEKDNTTEVEEEDKGVEKEDAERAMDSKAEEVMGEKMEDVPEDTEYDTTESETTDEDTTRSDTTEEDKEDKEVQKSGR